MNKKFIFTAAIISVIILILVLVLSPKKETSVPTPSPAASQAPRTELINLSEEKRQDAAIYVESIAPKLPIYLEKFKTSVGITTSINLYRLDDDPAETVRLEIYGLSYLNSNTNEKENPNVTAFKESYLKAIEMLESKNVDPSQLIFIYGDKEYVRKTTETWIGALRLRP